EAAFFDFQQSNFFAFESSAEKKRVPLRRENHASRPHLGDVKVARILGRRKLGRQQRGGGLVHARGRSLGKRLVRPLVIVDTTKASEATLLTTQSRSWRRRGVLLQSPVKALVTPVVLGASRPDPLDANTQTQQLRGEFGDSQLALRRNPGLLVVDSNGRGKPVFRERFSERHPNLIAELPLECPAAEKKPRAVVG